MSFAINTSVDPSTGAVEPKDKSGIGELVDMESKLLAVRGKDVLERRGFP